MISWFERPRRQPERATGGTGVPPRGCLLIQAFLLIWVIAGLLGPGTLSAFDYDRIVIHSDSVSLEPDITVGRFGTGKLYFDDPMDIAVDEDDQVFILDSGNYRVQVMNERERFETEWGSEGEEDGSFEEPVAMSFNPDQSFLVVLDKDPPRVQKFDPEGAFLLSFGEEGSRKGMLDEPVDLTVDEQDYIYVLDQERQRVLKFHHSGAFIEEWGHKGKSEERLEDPVSIAFSKELTGFIYVLDAGRNAVLKFERDGDFEEVIYLDEEIAEDGLEPVRIEAGEDNELFVLDALHGKLIRLNNDRVEIFLLRGDVALKKPSGIAIDSEKRIYITDLDKNRIFRFPLELN